MTAMIDLIDLQAQQRHLPSLMLSMQAVLKHGQFINGPEVQQLEAQLALMTQSPYVVTCASGTDALILILKAQQVKPGDIIIVPSFSFIASAEAIVRAGAVPYFIDVNLDDFNLSVESLQEALRDLAKQSMKARGVLAVDLFGQTVDYERLSALCHDENLILICDAAQSFGASHHGRKVGVFGEATATSFFPTKPLGCYGDGGAVFTHDEATFNHIKMLKIHGQSSPYQSTIVGMNSRLDTLQAAILLEKLKVFEEEQQRRASIAKRYTEALTGIFITPQQSTHNRSAWAQYTLRVPAAHRDAIMIDLKKAGVMSRIYYPNPLHLQPAYSQYSRVRALTSSELLSNSVLSIPMHPYLSELDVERVIETLKTLAPQYV